MSTRVLLHTLILNYCDVDVIFFSFQEHFDKELFSIFAPLKKVFSLSAAYVHSISIAKMYHILFFSFRAAQTDKYLSIINKNSIIRNTFNNFRISCTIFCFANQSIIIMQHLTKRVKKFNDDRRYKNLCSPMRFALYLSMYCSNAHYTKLSAYIIFAICTVFF